MTALKLEYAWNIHSFGTRVRHTRVSRRLIGKQKNLQRCYVLFSNLMFTLTKSELDNWNCYYVYWREREREKNDKLLKFLII